MAKKLIYCLDNQIIQEEIEIICKLICTVDDELIEMCADTLRSFDNEMGHSYIEKHPQIIRDIEKRIDTAGEATKRYYNLFCRFFQITDNFISEIFSLKGYTVL